MLSPTVESLGFEMLGIEFIRAGSNSTLRIYIDHENGIVVDDCAQVSRQVSAILDVEDPISDNYSLEVSSPGVERPLFTIEQYHRFVGHSMQIKLKMPVNNRFNLQGTLVSAIDNQIIIDVGNEEQLTLFLDNIRKANLMIEL
jgi:ribosome maturation factor RimP